MADIKLEGNNQRMQVAATLAPMHAEPRIATSWVSQLLAGHTVQVLESRGDWLRVRSEDSYEGWIHRGYLCASTGSELTWRVSLECRVREPKGIERDLPLLARISPSSDVIAGEFVAPEQQRSRFSALSQSIAHSAETLFTGASYMWGGVSPWGCDCSGFVQSVFSLHGIALQRDASQQAMASGDFNEGTPIGELLPGDLAFFSDRDDRHITHVGIMLSGQRMAHSGLSRGGFAIEKLEHGDEYVSRLRAQYLGSRRVLKQG